MATIILHLKYEREAAEICFSSALFSQLFKVFNLYSLVVVFCLIIFSFIQKMNKQVEKRKEDKKLNPDIEKAKEAHKLYHLKINMKHQTINCSMDPKFKEF